MEQWRLPRVERETVCPGRRPISVRRFLNAILRTIACGFCGLAASGPPAASWADDTGGAADVGEAAAMLTPHRARYNVSISVLGGTLTTDVTEAGPGFMSTSMIEPTGMSRIVARGVIQESSYFLADEDGVRPAQYRSIDTLSSDDKIINLDFDWREQVVTGSINDAEFRSELDGTVQDRVSLQYELMLDLLRGTASAEYSLLDGDELKLLQVRNIGTKEVKVPYGKFTTVGIQHSKKDSSRITTLWCAEELGYLPVIIEQHRDGKLRIRAVLTRYEPKGAAVAGVPGR
jgi:hypothetical protein